MSFSSDVKEELSKISNLANKELVKAEFIGYLISGNANILKNKIRYATESSYNINRFNKLLNNLNIDYNINMQGNLYVITFRKEEKYDMLIYKENNIELENDLMLDIRKNEQILKSIVRGAFLGAGSLNDPNKKYHLEIILSSKQNQEYIYEMLSYFNIKVKKMSRKSGYSIYIKEGEEISKLLALIGANNAVLKFEEVRVLRDMRNNINRIVNCETANLNKTINAAVMQIEDIKYLKEKKEFDDLSDSLKEIAYLRINNPDASLVELGEMLDKPIGKSGVNHRLKKIQEIANELRNKNR